MGSEDRAVSSAGQPDGPDAARFREVLGHFPTGVVVVTAIGPDGRPTGMAVGSFTSVSLDPPLVAFLPDRSSSTFPAIRDAGRFCVNVLSATQERLCRAFALKGADRFREVSWRPSVVTGSPVLDGVVAWIDCELDTVHEAGDHYLVLGRVRELGVEHPTIPLLFFQGGYGGFAATSLAVGANTDLLEQLAFADRARPEMARIADELRVECRAIAVAGDEQVIVATAQAPGSRQAPSRIGLRLPFVPPWGSQFLAWSPAEEVDRWIARLGRPVEPERRREIERDLELLREHGWALTYRSDLGAEVDATLEAIARYGATPGLQRRLAEIVPQLEVHADPGTVDDESARRIRHLSVPVFGPGGEVVLLLALLDLPEDLDPAGAERMVARLRQGAAAVSASLGVDPRAVMG
jgi:flavin reductase (DIM6/NTAB) family NADH-FMN oxidoreductase RutF/DNA-binding IclR family transcriptional regulator